MTREMIKLNARQQIKGKIGILFVMSIIIAVITWAASLIPMAGSIVNMVLITPAFTVSMIMIYLKLSNSEEIKVGDVFDGFYHFWGAFKVIFLVGLFSAVRLEHNMP